MLKLDRYDFLEALLIPLSLIEYEPSRVGAGPCQPRMHLKA